MEKRIIIGESQYKRLLREALSSRVFHFCGLNSAYEICASNTFLLQSAYAKDADNYDKKRKYYLSLTRVRNSLFGYSNKYSQGGVRIELDGELLNRNYVGKPINYWNGLVDKFEYTRQAERGLKGDSLKTQTSTENEDRLFSYEPIISDANKYIVSVDVLLPQKNVTEDEKQKIAYSFLKTRLNQKIRIFDSLEEFNKPNGKTVNDKVKYDSSMVGFNNNSQIRNSTTYLLSAVLSFIAYANKDFDTNFFKAAKELLAKYELSDYDKNIAQFKKDMERLWGIESIGEHLDACRRDLSDQPTREGHKVLKMLTDYLLSIGANSFRQGYKIKKEIAEDYFEEKHNGYTKPKIDTMKKLPILVSNSTNIIILNPQKDLFKDIMAWDDERCNYEAEYIAENEIAYDSDNAYHYTSKSIASLYRYLSKLFRKASFYEVIQTLYKIGFTREKLKETLNIDFETKYLDYYDATRYHTPSSYKIDDYRQQYKTRDKEIENYFKQHEQQQ